MNDRGKPIETRSEEVQEIMGAVPGWIVRQGIATLFLVVVALLAIAGLFRYPDVIPAEMTLTNSRPAARVVARVSGRIETLYVSDRQAVRAGDPLALIENPASAADVDRLSALLGAGFLDPDTALIRFAGVGELALGDIQSAFTDFIRALQDYRNYRELDYYPKKIAATRRQMARYGNYRASLERQVAAAEASHAIAGRQYRRDSLLYRQGIIAAEELEDGEVISIPGLTPTIEVVHTPGHTSDSVSLFVHSGEEGDAAADAQLEGILTGDTIAGRHTTMISETDGDLGDYLETLAKLQDRGVGIPLLPGHGPDQPDTAEVAARYIERREQRLEQVKEAMRELGDDAAVMDIVDKIYTDVDPVLRDAAAQSTRVTMRFLRGD